MGNYSDNHAVEIKMEIKIINMSQSLQKSISLLKHLSLFIELNTAVFLVDSLSTFEFIYIHK